MDKICERKKWKTIVIQTAYTTYQVCKYETGICL